MSAHNQLQLFLWFLLASGLGAGIGFQREARGHEAGIRTSALVCGGAAMFGLLSHQYGDSRVAQGVVQGIGFLGAGLVFQRGESVRGVTTAATIWVIAAIGLLVSEKFWLMAILATVTVIIALEAAPLSDRVYALSRKGRGPRDHPTSTP
jgi:putative Mg2+ transporter-C (MgtC) family protein